MLLSSISDWHDSVLHYKSMQCELSPGVNSQPKPLWLYSSFIHNGRTCPSLLSGSHVLAKRTRLSYSIVQCWSWQQISWNTVTRHKDIQLMNWLLYHLYLLLINLKVNLQTRNYWKRSVRARRYLVQKGPVLLWDWGTQYQTRESMDMPLKR